MNETLQFFSTIFTPTSCMISKTPWIVFRDRYNISKSLSFEVYIVSLDTCGLPGYLWVYRLSLIINVYSTLFLLLLHQHSSSTSKFFVLYYQTNFRFLVHLLPHQIFLFYYDFRHLFLLKSEKCAIHPRFILCGPCCSSFYFSVFCVVFLFCLSSSYVLCNQCCQFLWVVHSWLLLRFSLTFI